MKNSEQKIASSSLKMSVVTTISRVFGLVRDQIQAALLGTTFVADAFVIGFMLPNLLRRLLAEGNMIASFIPVFTEVEKESGIDEAKLFFRSIFTLLFIILLTVLGLGIILSPFIVKLLYRSASGNVEAILLATRLSQLMFPYLVFISLAALQQGVLNTRGYYSLSAASPILFNIVIITLSSIFYFFLPDVFPNMAYVFAIAVLIGGFVQFSYQMPFIRRLGFSFAPRFQFRDSHVRKMIKLFLPGIFGASIYQINLSVSIGFAGAIGEGRVSALTFATRLHEFTLGIFAVSIATVMLPTLSRYIAEHKIEEAKQAISYSLRLVAMATIPATVGFLVLGNEIVRMLFQYGVFSSRSVAMVSSALQYLSFSLFFVASYRIIVQSFYAMKDMKTPVYVAIFTFIVNTLSNVLCVYYFRFDIKGIAISSVCANSLSFIVLYLLLKRRMSVKHIITNMRSLIKTFIASLFMGMSVYVTKYYIVRYGFIDIDTRGGLILMTLSLVVLGVVIYFIVNISLKNKDFISLFDILRNRLNRNKQIK